MSGSMAAGRVAGEPRRLGCGWTLGGSAKRLGGLPEGAPTLGLGCSFP